MSIVAILSLEKNVTWWPNAFKKQVFKLKIKKMLDFPSMIGIIDETFNILV
jgi:hypothetical protein